MDKSRWFDVDKARLVLECLRMRQAYPGFLPKIVDNQLAWEGEIRETLPGIDAPPFRVRLLYPPAYPIRPPRIMPLSPELPEEHWGHRWHRWREGAICIVEPSRWEPSYTAADALGKAADWYYNYLAYVNGLVKEMPDVGRVKIAESAGES